MLRPHANVVFGGLVFVAAVIAILFWVPHDTGSEMIVHVRGRDKIGDALAPVIALCVLGVAGLLLMLEARNGGKAHFPSLYNLRYAGMLFAIFAVAMALMRWSGPLAVSLAGDLVHEGYRELRDTAPWKYLGFLTGGTFLVASLVSLTNLRLSWTALIVGLSAVILLILFYDLPFDDLLLPPNGDV